MSLNATAPIHILIKATYASLNDMLKALDDLESKGLRDIPQGYFTTRRSATMEIEKIPLAYLPAGSKFHIGSDDDARLTELFYLDPNANEYVGLWIKSDVHGMT